MTLDKLASLLRTAADAHHNHEAVTGEADPNWPLWYARYLMPHIVADKPVPACLDGNLDFASGDAVSSGRQLLAPQGGESWGRTD